MKPEPTIIIDSREQCPLDFPTLTATVGTLDTGDYSIVGLTNLVAVERKSIDDLLACMGRERDRFKRELQRLRAYRFRLLIVEASAADLDAGVSGLVPWRSSLKPAHVVGSLAAWTAQYGLPVWLAGEHAKAEGAGMSETSLAIMGKVEQMLAKATTIQEVKEVKDLALTAADFARRKGLGEKTIRKAQSYACRAKIKMGGLLTQRDLPKHAGPGRAKRGNKAVPGLSGEPTLAEMGISKRESSQAQGAHARIPVAVSVPAAQERRGVREDRRRTQGGGTAQANGRTGGTQNQRNGGNQVPRWDSIPRAARPWHQPQSIVPLATRVRRAGKRLAQTRGGLARYPDTLQSEAGADRLIGTTRAAERAGLGERHSTRRAWAVSRYPPTRKRA